MKNVIEVNEMNQGKAYDISYNGKLVVNVTVEEPMTKELGFSIINDLFVRNGISPRKYVDKVSFIETK